MIGAGSCCSCGGCGRGDVALFKKSKPVLLLPFLCLGFEGSPIPPNGFFVGGGGAATGSSFGVGGSGLLTLGGVSIGAARSLSLGVGASRILDSALLRTELRPRSSSDSASKLGFLARGWGRGPPLPPRGPFPSSANDVNFGNSFLFTGSLASYPPSCECKESFRGDFPFEPWLPIADVWLRRVDFSGGGGGSDFSSTVCSFGDSAVDPLLFVRVKERGTDLRFRRLDTILVGEPSE